MEKTSNYDLMRNKMEQAFVRYDQQEMIDRFHLLHTSEHLFITFVGEKYRVDRLTGKVERCAADGTFVHAGFNESMTIFDVLCCSKPGCRLSGEYAAATNLPGIANISAPGAGMFADAARFFTYRCDVLRQNCERLNGVEQKFGDVSYLIPLFDFMPVIVQFWDADDEFDAVLKILWDKNTLDFMHFETTFYAADHLMKRLTESI
ncbi:MAG: DUF3786 domain-containing protein [Oscillibacter sp.]|nr:DUF3786 domain-containing protein [Oscillibacter sp.]